jgi:hypothetical protein
VARSARRPQKVRSMRVAWQSRSERPRTDSGPPAAPPPAHQDTPLRVSLVREASTPLLAPMSKPNSRPPSCGRADGGKRAGRQGCLPRRRQTARWRQPLGGKQAAETGNPLRRPTGARRTHARARIDRIRSAHGGGAALPRGTGSRGRWRSSPRARRPACPPARPHAPARAGPPSRQRGARPARGTRGAGSGFNSQAWACRRAGTWACGHVHACRCEATIGARPAGPAPM